MSGRCGPPGEGSEYVNAGLASLIQLVINAADRAIEASSTTTISLSIIVEIVDIDRTCHGDIIIG